MFDPQRKLQEVGVIEKDAVANTSSHIVWCTINKTTGKIHDWRFPNVSASAFFRDSPKKRSLYSRKNLLNDAMNIPFFPFKYSQIACFPYNPHHVEKEQKEMWAPWKLSKPIFEYISNRDPRNTCWEVVILTDKVCHWFPDHTVREKVLHRLLIWTAKRADTRTWKPSSLKVLPSENTVMKSKPNEARYFARESLKP